MERLTEEKQIGPWASLKDKAEAKPGAFADYDCLMAHMTAVTRLKAYEDTGQTPEQVKDMAENAETRLLTWFESQYGYPVGVLMDLLDAKKEGRFVVLPCKVGDMVYAVGAQQIKQCQVGEIILDRGNEATCMVSFACDNDCEGCYFDSWHREYSGEWSCDGEYGNSTIKGEDFGKSVFLTREQAEAALKKEADREN